MNRYLKYSLVFVAVAVVATAVYFLAIRNNNHAAMGHESEVYTCPMHPEIIRNKPGNCPICGMHLVKKPMDMGAKNEDFISNVLKPTDNFVVGEFETITAIDTALSSEINLPGVVEYNPNSSINIAARISGRIEKLYVNYKYQRVNKGQKLFDLYSPELLTEQQNFVYLVSNDAGNKAIINASKQKLLLYGMSQAQINTLASSKIVKPQITIYSPASGIIAGAEKMENGNSSMQNFSTNTEILNVKEGSYINKDETIFKLLNTDKVWGVFNVIQGNNSLIKINQAIKISSELDEAETFDAQINFVETQLNPADKTNTVRVYLNNEKLNLPIGLRLQGVVKTAAVQGVWLERQAVVSIGNRQIAFKKMDNGFKATAIKTGIIMNNYMQILEGLTVKDSVAKNGQYFIDSESFIKTDR